MSQKRLKSWGLTLGSLLCLLAFGWTLVDSAVMPWPPSLFVPTWTRSFQLYQQPHAVWLSEYDKVGANVPLLTRVLNAAVQAKQIPELVIYAIPLRDLGQSSEGGFSNYDDYLADNRENAKRIERFASETGLHPIVYIEPDSLPLAVQYRLDHHFNTESQQIYADRIRVIKTLISIYQAAGARTYLEAGHSDWFDYADENVQRIADALNDAGIARATGLSTNVSNRQPVTGTAGTRNEFHYLTRLLPLLDNSHLEVRVDTSRNGGTTTARRYFLASNGQLWDSEWPSGRLVGAWKKMATATSNEVWLQPFFGKPKRLQRLIDKEKYTWDAQHSVLSAPGWLDAVGDVKLGPAPTDTPPISVRSVIQHYRYIKPPDDCDGAINCPPGASKKDTNTETAKRQPQHTSKIPW